MFMKGRSLSYGDGAEVTWGGGMPVVRRTAFLYAARMVPFAWVRILYCTDHKIVVRTVRLSEFAPYRL